MVDIGRNLKILQSGIIENSICKKCNAKNELHFSIYGGLVNILGIPIAPIRKSVFVQCNNCKKTYWLKDLDKENKANFKKQYLKNPIKTPLWHFSGMLIIIFVMSFAIYFGIDEAQKAKIYILHPKSNDLYRVNNNSVWTSFKVQEVQEDSVSVYLNDISLTTYEGLEDTNIDSNFKIIKKISKKDLKIMFDEKTIYQIDRK